MTGAIGLAAVGMTGVVGAATAGATGAAATTGAAEATSTGGTSAALTACAFDAEDLSVAGLDIDDLGAGSAAWGSGDSLILAAGSGAVGFVSTAIGVDLASAGATG